MFPLWIFTYTVPFALAGEKYINPKEHPIKSSYDGAFCCDKRKNLIINGHFENGNANFHSSYAHDSDILPGQYDVTSDATDFVTTITDHSYCQSPFYYSMNDKYLLVNGLTNQPAGSNSVIWQQKVEDLKKGKRYRFCANFKNLQQCTHDVLPLVTVQLSTGLSRTVTIDTNQEDSCDWQQISFCFDAGSGSRVTVKIVLKESSLGDGNDLAIDDVSVQELVDPQLTTTVQYQYNTNRVEGSINTISAMDDNLPAECGGRYYWFVLTLQSYSLGMFTINWSAPRGWGNSMFSVRLNPLAVGPPWHLTTSFPGFVFSSNTLYAIGMVTPECCKGCLARGSTYHVVYPSFFRSNKSFIGGMRRNDDGLTEKEGMYTNDDGLTEKDLLAVEEWVVTSAQEEKTSWAVKSAQEKEAPESRDQQSESFEPPK